MSLAFYQIRDFRLIRRYLRLPFAKTIGNDREDHGEGVQDSGKTGVGIRYGVETWTLKKAQEHKLDVPKRKNKRDTETEGNHKESPGKYIEVVWTCREKRVALRRMDGDENENTRKGEERKA